MKSIVFVFVALLLSSFSGYRSVYFGLPVNQDKIKKNDLIIINVPNNVNGRFVSSKELEELISFLNTTKHEIEIGINIFYLENDHCQLYSDFLAGNLQKILSDSVSKKNYSILSKGNTNPIFCDTAAFDFKAINTRFDISIAQ